MPFPLIIIAFLHYHQSSSPSHLPLERSVQRVATAAPPHHGVGLVALKHAKRVCGVQNVEAQAHACAQVVEAMRRHPLPQHAECGTLTVFQHQARMIRLDAALQQDALQNKQAFFWTKAEQDTMEEKTVSLCKLKDVVYIVVILLEMFFI